MSNFSLKYTTSVALPVSARTVLYPAGVVFMDGAAIVLPGVYRLQGECVPNNQLYGVADTLRSLFPDDDLARRQYVSAQFPFAILQFTTAPLPRPFIITSRRRAQVTSALSEQMSAYAGFSQTEYLSLICSLALTQLRTLAINEILEAEDMLYTCHPGCVFTMPETLGDFGIVLEHRHICGGCMDFYSALGADRELASVLACTHRD
jgi:hypothetical protein